MKNRLIVYFLLLLSYRPAAQNPDTTIHKVYVGFRYSQTIFPEDWQAEPINASGEQISRKEIPRCKIIIVRALNKYPENILRRNLKYVYFLKDMKFYDVG